MARANPNETYHPRSRKSRELTRKQNRKENISAKEREHKKKLSPEKIFYTYIKGKIVESNAKSTIPDDVYVEWISEFVEQKLKDLIGEKKENQLKTGEQLAYIYYKNIKEGINGSGLKFIDLSIKINVERLRNWDCKKVEIFADCKKKLYKVKTNISSTSKTSDQSNEVSLNTNSMENSMDMTF